jgi:hypothetical protein
MQTELLNLILNAYIFQIDSGQNPLGNNGNGHQRRSPTENLDPAAQPPMSMAQNSGARPGTPVMMGQMPPGNMHGNQQGLYS